MKTFTKKQKHSFSHVPEKPLKQAIRILCQNIGKNSQEYGAVCIHQGFNRGSIVNKYFGDNPFIQGVFKLTKNPLKRTLILTDSKNDINFYMETVVNVTENFPLKDTYFFLDGTEFFGTSATGKKTLQNFDDVLVAEKRENKILLNGKILADFVPSKFNPDNLVQVLDNKEISPYYNPDDLAGSNQALLMDCIKHSIADNASADPLGEILSSDFSNLFKKKMDTNTDFRLFFYPDYAAIYNDTRNKFFSAEKFQFNRDYLQPMDFVFSMLSQRQYRQVADTFKGVSNIQFQVFNRQGKLKLEFSTKNLYCCLLFAESVSPVKADFDEFSEKDFADWEKFYETDFQVFLNQLKQEKVETADKENLIQQNNLYKKEIEKLEKRLEVMLSKKEKNQGVEKVQPVCIGSAPTISSGAVSIQLNENLGRKGLFIITFQEQPEGDLLSFLRQEGFAYHQEDKSWRQSALAKGRGKVEQLKKMLGI